MSNAVTRVNTSQPPRPVVAIIDGTARADTHDIAAYFSKAHKSVLVAVRTALARSPEMLGHEIVPTFEAVATGNGAKRDVMSYRLDRDAFALVVFGFTGERAHQWKRDYIAAFNAMEKELSRRSASAPVQIDVRDIGQMQTIALQLLQLTQERAAELVVAKGEIEAAKPMIDAYLAFLDDDGLCHLSTAARVIGAPEKLFFAWLRDKRYCFDADGFLQPRADLRKDGHLKVKLKPNGYHGTSPQTMVTRSGLAWLRQRWAIGPGKTIALQAAVAAKQGSFPGL
ncbi:phage regulatory protein/antirepressor Ant [Methylobacterium sp. V23]|uniref:Rha family transcriptional regulator n=1 Tax=Methylobacteriaceae TaxID=119045 RepID=UPI000CDAA0AA|nr:phage regulatory protein/antirepressor Ant [Methylobacterium sp. V23]MCP1549442.1 Rha family phage regulatory protein [Methylorubrum zatmanii]MCP1553945.1 Rha family phage regulatory protein [Methylorubrum extorquens]MCP1579744.1 Rha family phage regulatory protein [Methylorubrum extorquens]POR41002.1 transcriptional regulator [Methylobacterium sp. V23]